MSEEVDYMDFVKETMELVLERAATMAAEGEVQPITFLIRHNPDFKNADDPPFQIAIMPIMDGMSKDDYAQAIALVVKKFKALGYIFMSEAWSSYDPAAHAAMGHASLADLDVEKEEILMASYSGIGGIIMARRTISPDREIGPFEIMMEESEHGKADGRFVNLGVEPEKDLDLN